MPVAQLAAGPIEYEDTGGEGQALVLLHGLAMDGRLWGDVISEHDGRHRFVLPTLPLGARRRPMHPDADLSLRGLGRIVAEFLERLDLRDVTLCFNDWGGAQVMIADGLMERVGRLVLVSWVAFENYPPGIPGRLASLSAKLPGGIAMMRRALLVPSLRRLPFTFGRMTKRGVPDPQMRAWLEPLARREIRRDLAKYAGDARRGRRDMLAATAALGSFDRPVLVVWAAEDRIMPVAHGRGWRPPSRTPGWSRCPTATRSCRSISRRCWRRRCGSSWTLSKLGSPAILAVFVTLNSRQSARVTLTAHQAVFVTLASRRALSVTLTAASVAQPPLPSRIPGRPPILASRVTTASGRTSKSQRPQ
jgi:pimeloyl-ACP methyl ester carboxylesterase